MILYINWDRPAVADTALQELASIFYEHPGIAQAILGIADYYGDVHNNYEKALQLHQYVVENWPDNEDTIWSQSGLVLSYIALKDEVSAQAAYEQLLNRFSSNAHIHAAVCQAASAYWDADQPEKTRQLYEHAFNTWPDYVWDEEGEGIDHKFIFAQGCVKTGEPQKAIEIYQDMFAMQPEVSQAVGIMESYTSLRIALGDDPNLQPILDKFSTEFLNEEKAPGVLYEIGKAYEAAGAKDKAFEVYQAVLDNWTPNKDELWAREGLIKANITLGNEPNIIEELEDLIIEFADSPDLAEVILELGSDYYRQARYRAMEGDTEGEKAFYRDAISVWEWLTEEFVDSEAAANAYYRSGICYAQELGRYQKGIDCFQAAVDNRPEYEYASEALYLAGKYYKKLRNSGQIAETEANAQIEQAYISIVEDYPDSTSAGRAMLELGRLYFKMGRFSDAIVHYEQYFNEHPEQICLIGTGLYQAYKKSGDIETAQLFAVELKNSCPDK